MKNSYDFSKGQRGTVMPTTGKTRITICLDDDLLEFFREKAGEQGKGYQTLINEALRQVAIPSAEPLTAESLRRIIREELNAA